MIIKGNIVNLKEINSSYEKDLLLKWRNKDRIRINMYNAEIITPEGHTRWLNKTLSDPSKVYWIVYNLSNNVPIALACLLNIDRNLKNCEWAFYIGEDEYLNKGHAIEIEYLVLNYVFEELKFHRLFCTVLDFNKQVVSFHKNFGFMEEGKYRSYIYRDNRWIDVILLSILEDEYFKNKDRILKIFDKICAKNKTK